MTKNILKILLIFTLGALGGIWAQISLLPFLTDCSYFQNFQFVKNIREKVVLISPRTEVTVQENIALRMAVEKVEKVVVGVKTKTLDGEILKGSGLVVTSDGLIVTLADLVPRGSSFYFYVDDQWPAFQILKRDLENNLALVKIEDGGLGTCSFADLGRIKLGERVFLVGMDFSTSTPQKIVNEGIISFFDKDSIQTNILEKQETSGSPLFDIGGNVLGLNIVAQNGKISTIPIAKIRIFIGL